MAEKLLQDYIDNFEKRRRIGFWWLVFSVTMPLIVIILITFTAVLYFMILSGLITA